MLDSTLQTIGQVHIGAARVHAPSARGLAAGQAVAAGAGVNRRVCLPHEGIGDFAPRTSAGVHRARRLQGVKRCVVGISAMVLILHRAIPFQPIRFQRTQDCIRRTGRDSRRIQVVDAQPPLAALRFSVEKTTERRQQRTEMQWPGGGRGKAATIVILQTDILI